MGVQVETFGNIRYLVASLSLRVVAGLGESV